jgi:hypothetical protein
MFSLEFCPHFIRKIRNPIFNHIVIGPLKLSIMVFSDITQCSLVNRYQRFGGKTASVFGLENRSDNGVRKFNANLGTYLGNDPSCIVDLKTGISSKPLYCTNMRNRTFLYPEAVLILVDLLTAIGLSPGGSTHLHTNYAQNNTTTEQHK